MIRIVIVEDHEMVREGLKVLINHIHDMKVVGEFSSGQEWLEQIGNIICDVILIDLDMPVMDGLTAINKTLAVDNDAKIIVLTMHSDTNFFKEAFVNGAKGYILKHKSANELEKGIREVNGGHTYFSDEFLINLASSFKEEEDKSVERKQNVISLSDQELQLLSNICKGYTNKQLADSLFLSVKAIESQKSKLMRKTYCQNNASLIVWAIRNNVVDI